MNLNLADPKQCPTNFARQQPQRKRGCRMARYFFKLVGDPHRFDTEGMELQDEAEAKQHGMSFFSQLMRDEPHALVDGQGLTLEVSDEYSAVLLRINASAAAGPKAESGR